MVWDGEEEKVQGEGEVPFYGRGRVRCPRPRQNFLLVTAGAKVLGPWHQGFPWRRPVCVIFGYVRTFA